MPSMLLQTFHTSANRRPKSVCGCSDVALAATASSWLLRLVSEGSTAATIVSSASSSPWSPSSDSASESLAIEARSVNDSAEAVPLCVEPATGNTARPTLSSGATTVVAALSGPKRMSVG